MEPCTIYVITHKKIRNINQGGYKILLVGACRNNNFENTYYHDNEGDNISEYNDSYCELTGLYWIWKNSKDDVVGLVHYRRLFARIKTHFDFIGRHIVLSKNEPYSIISVEEVKEKLRDTDIIVKKSEFRIRTVKQIFIKQIGKDMFDKIVTAIRELEPSYMDMFKKVCNSHSHINCNMFVGKRTVVSNYCKWIFPILEYIDNMKIKETGDRYHNREIGYVSELLLGVWLKCNNVKYTTCPVVFTEDPMVANGVLSIGEFWGFVKNRTKKKFQEK